MTTTVLFIWEEVTPVGHVGTATVNGKYLVFMNDDSALPVMKGAPDLHAKKPEHCQRCEQLIRRKGPENIGPVTKR